MKKNLLFLLLIPAILIGQSRQTMDTLDVVEIEWQDNIAHKKGDINPFTGIVTIPGVLNYPRDSKIGWHKTNNKHFSTVTLVSGIFDGTYSRWSKKNGKKVSEFTITGHWTKIIINGPYTLWHENGQMAGNGIYKNGKRNDKRTTWYKNGQTRSEQNYIDGTLVNKSITWYESGQIKSEQYHGHSISKSIVWDENGQKSVERLIYDKKLIKLTEKDENGKILEAWPEVDKDNFGLGLFLNEFVAIINSKNYPALKNLLPSKEDIINIEFRDKGKEPSSEDLKMINNKWAEFISNKIDDIIEQVIEGEYIFENLTTNYIVYDYELMNEDNSTTRVKWPKSINYDISTAKYVTAETTIVLEAFAIAVAPVYLNNKWVFGETGNGGIIEVKY